MEDIDRDYLWRFPILLTNVNINQVVLCFENNGRVVIFIYL